MADGTGWTRGAAKAAIALVLLAGLTEAGLRLVLGLGNPVLIAPDAAAGYTLKPNQNVWRFFCRTRTDGNGMRSEAPAARPANGALRVMFVGDSLTYGTSRVSQDDLFTERVKRELPAVLGRPVEVLNASAGAWAIENELGYVRSRGVFNSHLVLLVLNSGDLGQPRSRVEDVGRDLPVKAPAMAMEELWERYLLPRLRLAQRKVDAGDAARVDANQVAASLAELEEFRQLVTGQGARMGIVYIPFRKEMPEPAGAMGRTLREWAAGHGVPLMDMTAVESGHSVKEIDLDAGVHLNAEGHRLVAAEIEREWVEKMGPGR